MMKKLRSWYWCVCLLLTTACHHPKATTSASGNNPADIGSERLYQYEWKLYQLGKDTVASSSMATLAFTPGQVNQVKGHTGCNRLSGSFELNGTNGIKFSPIVTTKMACIEDAANETEQKFMAAMNKATAWECNDQQLTLLNGTQVLAILRAR